MKIISQLIVFVTLASPYLVIAQDLSDQFMLNRSSRSGTVKQLAKRYKRSFTLLCLGPIKHTMPFKIADEFGKAVCVIIDQDESDTILKKCSDDEPSNVIFLKHKLSLKDLKRLGECEHFDVVVALETVDQFGQDWKEAIDLIAQLGDYNFIEVPVTKSPNYHEYLKSIDAHQVVDMDNRALYLCAQERRSLKRRRWNFLVPSRPGEYTIESNFKEKFLLKNKSNFPPATSKWHAGINLLTFKVLHGVYPTKDTIRDMIKPLGTIEHNDLKIFNIIIQGERLVPIDCNEPGRHNDPAKEVERLLNQFRSRHVPLAEILEDLKDADFEADELL